MTKSAEIPAKARWTNLIQPNEVVGMQKGEPEQVQRRAREEYNAPGDGQQQNKNYRYPNQAGKRRRETVFHDLFLNSFPQK